MISRLSLRTILIAGVQRALGRYQLLAKGLAGEYPG